MHTQVYRKCLFHLSIVGISISILVGFYDLIFGYIWETIHLILEVIEMGLDNFIEHTFHLELHETQLIVFYIMLAIGGILIYVTWKILVYFCKDFNVNFKSEWLELKTAISLDWQALSAFERLILLSVFVLINYLLSFLLF